MFSALPPWLARLSCLPLFAAATNWAHDYHQEHLASKHCRNSHLGLLNLDLVDQICPLTIDDESVFETGTWDPWTYPPACIPAKKREDPKLCTYTYTSFRGSNGLSILTTPEIAANSGNVLDDIDPQWLQQGRGNSKTDLKPSCYTIDEIHGKGKGVIANRIISSNEIIMTDLPVLLRPVTLETWEYGPMCKLLANAGNRLPIHDRGRVMTMARSTGGKANFLDDVMNTNSFAIRLGGQEHAGLYPDIARINHACRPNTFIRFSTRSLAMEVVAYREIKSGEEISLSYVPLNLVSEDRQQLIQEWGFNCSCSLCSSTSKIKISDRRRQRIQDILEQLDLPVNREPKTVKKLADETFDLCEKEGMLAQAGDFHGIVANVYVNMGYKHLARYHGKIAVEKLRHFAGYDNDRTLKAVRFLEGLDDIESTRV